MVASIRIEITADASRAQREVAGAASSFDKFKGAMGTLVVPAGIAVAAIGGIGKSAIDAASAAQQAMGATEAVFGASAGAIQSAAKNSADSVGMSSAAYMQMASQVGGALTGMGVPLDQAAASTNDLMLRAADLASVYGGTAVDAANAMASAYRGEYDGLQRLIPTISAAKIQQQQAADAAAGLTFASEEQARAHAVTAVIMGESASAAGNFAKESDTAAGAAERSRAAYENAMAALGEKLLPAVTDLTIALTGLATWVTENSTLVTVLGGIVGGLALAVLAVNAALAVGAAATAAWSAVTTIATTVSGGFATAIGAVSAAFAFLAANPIVLVIAAIVAVVAAVIYLMVTSEDFRNTVIAMWEAVAGAAAACWQAVKSAAVAVFDWLTGAIRSVGDFIQGVWDTILSGASTAWDAIKAVVVAVWDGIKSAISGVADWILGIWDKIKSTAVACWDAIKGAVNALLTPFRAVKDAVQWLIDKLKMAWDWAVKVISKIPFVGGMIGGSAATVTAAGYGVAAPVPAASAGWAAARTGGGINITVQGALDPVAVADQIEQLLLKHRRRTRGVTVGQLELA